ncbi:acyl carrier protein [Aequorivita vladivostokensis]|uniref:Acyl carrier protein n=1 Tax=Aequorivita vladivostokensis TaxID=171194 RepID=A0ABR5DH11_9FLAO|nr:phosphopantetheine-binding protein [Aequorivita vladivostokensis]MAB58578.1 acyl carrier protein [Aequorivita sp.]KJJ38064.1 acyl carrier protein [Aequorivita vladivostokensis]MAO48815.1 acyl carrier protein [Aequorivita sp.]MBF30283.1 acyl carrier protein [Aequorivita sp.]HAV53726.1 acyl carrier protein [Aequorivita sp.]|tara:strand:+ start:261780 stop:262037 length:258 start_codon:yes stop_codon:yes gene_type:complete
MNSEEIFALLEPIIITYLPDDVSANEINRESDLTRELNINSAHLVDIILDIEDVFNIEFKNEDMEKLRNVDDAILLIQQKTSASQ